MVRSKPEQWLPRNGAATHFAATIWCVVNPDRAYPGVISEVHSNGRVLPTSTDKTNNNYVSFTGKALVGDDRDRIARRWSAWALACWKIADDPDRSLNPQTR